MSYPTQNQEYKRICYLCEWPWRGFPIFDCDCIRSAEFMIKKAVRADTRGEFDNALKLYTGAIARFKSGLRFLQSLRYVSRREAIEQKIDTYKSRVEQIKLAIRCSSLADNLEK